MTGKKKNSFNGKLWGVLPLVFFPSLSSPRYPYRLPDPEPKQSSVRDPVLHFWVLLELYNSRKPLNRHVGCLGNRIALNSKPSILVILGEWIAGPFLGWISAF